MNDLWETLTPGSAAMIMLLREGTLKDALPHIHLHEPGTVVHSSLSPEFEEQLKVALEEAKRKP